MAWLGLARRGSAWLDLVWFGFAWFGSTSCGLRVRGGEHERKVFRVSSAGGDEAASGKLLEEEEEEVIRVEKRVVSCGRHRGGER